MSDRASQKGWLEKLLGKPHVIFSFLALILMAGIMGYNQIHRNLFPNSNYPEIAVVIVQPGASAKMIARNIAVPVEEELYTLEGIRRVYSSTIDEVSVIRAEFDYSVAIDSARSDVKSAIDKIRSKLPSDIQEPQIIKITETTAPIAVVALYAKNEGNPPLETIRNLASTQIRHRLLQVEGVANVEVFGGYEKALQIVIDKKRLDETGLSINRVIAVLSKNNTDRAVGFVTNDKGRYLLSATGQRNDIEALRAIALAPGIYLGDVAQIFFGSYQNKASYFGNANPAIALSIQREKSADVIKTIEAVEKELEALKSRYSALAFEISDTQKETIEQSTRNMFESLRDAIVMSTIVVFLFLASLRQILVVLVTVPLVYASTVALMWLFGIEFNVVTLTAVILALGLLLDDAVVVMENIERHYSTLGKPIKQAVLEGTREIMFADLSGTVTTMIALSPMLFVGGYPQTVFAPLVGTLLLALFASYVISITAVPLLSLYILSIRSQWLLRFERLFETLSRKANDAIASFFIAIVSTLTRFKSVALLSFVVLIALFVTSVKLVLPTVGQELMPPMDTGALNIRITTRPNAPIEQSEAIMRQVGKLLSQSGELLRSSGSIGSEAGVMSIGSGSDSEHLYITATYVDRHSRDETIWQIAQKLRRQIAAIEGVKHVEVTPYGSTPLASIRATVDARLSGEDETLLYDQARKVQALLQKTKGIVSTSVSWDLDKKVYDLLIDEEEALRFSLLRSDVILQLQSALKGVAVATFPKQNGSDYPIRVWLDRNTTNSVHSLMQMQLATPKGLIPLSQIATLTHRYEPTLITREDLAYTIDVYGDRQKAAVSHIMADFENKLQTIDMPDHISLEQTGEIKQFHESAKRMIGAIVTAVVLILLSLIVLFGNIPISLMILFSIPLTIIGASWTMLAINYHVSMPAMMGFMLLAGIIVNNAILLIHFALERIKEGIPKRQAMLESIRIRTRPVLMTAFAVSVGMLPVAQGAAIGLERLAPLGAVAIGGLIVGTIMTLIFIPTVFVYLVRESTLRKSV